MKREKLIAILLFAAISFSARADWLVKTYSDGSSVVALADADRLTASTMPIATGTIPYTDLLGYSTGEGTGHYSLNYPVPGLPQNQPTDDYAVEVTGTMNVPTTGYYTFGLNTDDGARLVIDGTSVITDDAIHPPRDSAYVPITLTAGAHSVQWIWFNHFGGATAEAFWAAGSYSSFNSSFSLLTATVSNDGLIAFYPFRGNANDASGNGNNGTAYEAILTTNISGSPNSAYSFNGISSYIQVPDSASLESTNAVSVSLWFNQQSLPPGQFACLLYKANSTVTSGFADRSYSLWVTPGGGEIHFTSTATGAASQTAIYTSSGLFGLNQWVHVVGIVDASNQQMSVYVNGNLVGTAAYPSKSILSGNYPLRIGSYVNYSGGDQAGFNGLIADVRIYNRALSRTEVQQLYSLPESFPLTIVQTNRTPTTAEITPLLAALPTTSQLLAYHGGIFTANLVSIDASKPTIVLTHGWIPLRPSLLPPFSLIPVFTPNGVDDWPTTFAAQLRANGVFTGNIVAWDWSQVARSVVDKPGIPEQQTGDQGRALGQALLLKLGANYSMPIQFIGHSLGTGEWYLHAALSNLSLST